MLKGKADRRFRPLIERFDAMFRVWGIDVDILDSGDEDTTLELMIP